LALAAGELVVLVVGQHPTRRHAPASRTQQLHSDFTSTCFHPRSGVLGACTWCDVQGLCHFTGCSPVSTSPGMASTTPCMQQPVPCRSALLITSGQQTFPTPGSQLPAVSSTSRRRIVWSAKAGLSPNISLGWPLFQQALAASTGLSPNVGWIPRLGDTGNRYDIDRSLPPAATLAASTPQGHPHQPQPLAR
jgi:hypothetical protein